MSITPDDLKQYAEEIASYSDKTETDTRTIINRAYYAAYHYAQQVALVHGYVCPNQTSTHQALLDFLAEQEHEDFAVLADNLKLLRKLRRKADYQLDQSITSKHEKDSLTYMAGVFTIK